MRVFSGFLVAGGDATELLEAVEAPLDEIAPFVDATIVQFDRRGMTARPAISEVVAISCHNPFAKPPAVLGRLKAVERILE